MRRLVLLLVAVVSMTNFVAAKYDKVKITPDISYIYVYHKGKVVKVHRIQDTKHKLTGEYAKIYRPKQYIQPIKLMDGIATIGEVEVLKFMKDKVNNKKGLIIDTRDRVKYNKESIPSAVNIPAAIRDKTKVMEKIFFSLGMKKSNDGSWNFNKVMELVVYCDGLWCRKSSDMIKTLVDLGYPADKIYYYRGGMQAWQSLGLTVIKGDE